MIDEPSPDTHDAPPDPRKERLAAQLRANLRRRKAQGREQAVDKLGAETRDH